MTMQRTIQNWTRLAIRLRTKTRINGKYN